MQGQAGIDDVFDNEDVAPFDLGVEVFEDSNDTRGLGRAAI